MEDDGHAIGYKVPRRGGPPAAVKTATSAHFGLIDHRKMFVFFSNRLGCLGSLLVSAVITIILLLILGVL